MLRCGSTQSGCATTTVFWPPSLWRGEPSSTKMPHATAASSVSGKTSDTRPCPGYSISPQISEGVLSVYGIITWPRGAHHLRSARSSAQVKVDQWWRWHHGALFRLIGMEGHSGSEHPDSDFKCRSVSNAARRAGGTIGFGADCKPALGTRFAVLVSQSDTGSPLTR